MAAIRCPQCSSLTGTSTGACKMCGEKLPSKQAPAVEARPAGPRKCPDCAELSQDPKVCQYCGHKFREPRPCPDCAEIMTTTVCEYCGYDIRARARAAGEKAQRDAAATEVLGTAAAIGLFGVVGGAIVDDMTGGQTKKSYFSRKKKR